MKKILKKHRVNYLLHDQTQQLLIYTFRNLPDFFLTFRTGERLFIQHVTLAACLLIPTGGKRLHKAENVL